MSAKKAQPRVALLTSCSVSRNYATAVRIGDAPQCKTMDELLEWWTIEMDAYDGPKYTPGELYAGIGFWTVTEIAQHIGHKNIYIVTGGVGLVDFDTKIVPYDFTSATSHSPNAPEKVRGEKFLPHVWWGKINENRQWKSSTPIATHLLDRYDIIIGALPKAFIKYIQTDLEACGPDALRNKIFIPIPQSMMGSVRAHVRDAFIPYDATYTSGLSINRVNKSQVVAKKFLTHVLNSGHVVEEANEIATLARQGVANSNEEVDYEAMFNSFPIILDAPEPGEAIRRARALGLKIGGKIRFTGAWRGAKGQIKVNVTKAELGHAEQTVLQVLRNSSHNEGDNDELLHRIGLFVEAVRGAARDKAFTAKDLAAWGKLTYGEDGGDIASAVKLTYVLSYNTRYLGIELVTSTPTNTYKVAT